MFWVGPLPVFPLDLAEAALYIIWVVVFGEEIVGRLGGLSDRAGSLRPGRGGLMAGDRHRGAYGCCPLGTGRGGGLAQGAGLRRRGRGCV